MSAMPESTAARAAAKSSFSSSFLTWYFIFIWGSGFLATKAGIQYAAPFTFLCLRFIVGLLCLAPIVLIARPRWPAAPREWLHIIVAGLLMHAIHLSGSHYAQYLGMSAGVTAVILATQTLLTAVFAALWMGEKPGQRQWAGIAIGLSGVAMVVWHKIDIAAVSPGSLIAVGTGLLALTAGTLYQRKFCAQADLRSSALVQFAASLLLLAPLSLYFEGASIRWAWQLLGAVLFLVIFASIFAVNALHTLMRRGAATRVTSMLYLPPVVAVALEWLLFGVRPTALTIFGVAVVCIGVSLAAGAPRNAPVRRAQARVDHKE